jgi:hypothetical protein
MVGYVRRPLDPGTLMSKIAGMLPFENEEGLVSLLLGDAGRALRTASVLVTRLTKDCGVRLYES